MPPSTPAPLPPEDAKCLEPFDQTLAACTKQLDAFHLSLQTAARAGARQAAVCLADPALEGRLVVRLSLGMKEASNRVLTASGPGTTAALAAFAAGETRVVERFGPDLRPTELEEQQGITGAAYLPIRSPSHGLVGLLLAAPPPERPFTPAHVALLGQIADRLGASLDRLLPPAHAAGIADAALPFEVGEPLFDAFRECLNTDDIETLSDRTLEYCLRFTASEFGFVGYVEPETGHLICPTMTRGIFAQCQVAGKTVVFEKPGGLGGLVLDLKVPLIANDPASHPASVGTPPGHLPIRKFLAVPCLSQGVLVGMIALANKDSDYQPSDLKITTAFADIYAAAVARFFSERSLTASRNRFSQLYENAPCGYQTIAPDGLILEINATALGILGRTRDEVTGTFNIGRLLTTTGRALLANQIEALKRGQSAASVELHVKRPDGNRVPVLHSVSAVRDDRGVLQEVRCTLVDVSPTKELRETREYLEALFKGSTSPIMVFDATLTVTRFNAAFERISGYAAQEVRGRRVEMLLPGQGRERWLAALSAAAGGTQLAAAEMPIRTKGGEQRDLLWSSSNIYTEDGEVLATIMDGVDITERKQYERALRRTNRALKTLSRGNEALVHAGSEPELTQQICDILVQVGGYRMAWIGYAHSDPKQPIEVVARAGHAVEYTDSIHMTWDEQHPNGRGPAGKALRSRTPQLVQDVEQDPEFGPWREKASANGYRSLAAFPLHHGGELYGVLALYGEIPRAFDAEELELLTELSGDLGFGIAMLRTREAHRLLEEERGHYLQQLNASMQATVQAIAATIEKRDPYTAGHQQRVARLAVAIAHEMGLPPGQVEGVHFGGLIHDIGKISVPTELLSKPGRLSDLEYRVIQLHATGGHEILKDVKFPWPIADMVLQHHERLDGSGYPHHLVGDAIRLEARILAVADVVEAMSSPRPYRAAVGIDAALAEIKRNSGRLYDADVVDACIRLIESGFRIDASN